MERKRGNGKTRGKIFKMGILDSKTSRYLIRKKIKRNKLRERAGKRVWVEKRLEKEKRSELTRLC